MAEPKSGVRVPAKIRPSLLKLRLSMIGVWAAITGLATLILTAILLYLGMPIYGVYGILGFVIVFHFFQWLIGPYIVNAIYSVREVKPHEYPWLHRIVEKLSKRSGLEKPPKLMLAEIDTVSYTHLTLPTTPYV